MKTAPKIPLPDLQTILTSGEPRPVVLEKVLSTVLTHFSSETGTIHALDATAQRLLLVAQVGLPPQILPAVQSIPVGKGIAGQVASENRPVTICNLTSDTSGIARPEARQTGVGGALCVPIRRGDTLVGTFGIGTKREHDYSAAEINALQDLANIVGQNDALRSS